MPNYDPTWRFSLPQDNVLVEDSQTHILFNTNLSKNWEFRNGFLLRRTSDRYFVTEGIFGFGRYQHDVSAKRSTSTTRAARRRIRRTSSGA